MATAQEQLWDVALDQYGYVTLRDAVELDIDDYAVRMLVARGQLDREPASARASDTWVNQAQQKLGMDAGRLGWLIASTVVVAALQRAVDETGRSLFAARCGAGSRWKLPPMRRAQATSRTCSRHPDSGPRDLTAFDGAPTLAELREACVALFAARAADARTLGARRAEVANARGSPPALFE